MRRVSIAILSLKKRAGCRLQSRQPANYNRRPFGLEWFRRVLRRLRQNDNKHPICIRTTGLMSKRNGCRTVRQPEFKRERRPKTVFDSAELVPVDRQSKGQPRSKGVVTHGLLVL